MAAKGGQNRSRSNAPAETNGQGRDAGQVHLLMDLEFLKGLIEAVDGSGIDTLEINRAGTRIRISKTPQATGATMAAVPQPMHASAPALAAAPDAVAGGAATAEAAPVEETATRLVDVVSPMVGTFYRAPAPEAPSYVELGSQVHKGQTLCILEAMKLMNELECEVDGIVREILVENADPVEYGQVLFRVEPA
jgi:acetyl-CoA carboxylase biotin carboxyl carrier protein